MAIHQIVVATTIAKLNVINKERQFVDNTPNGVTSPIKTYDLVNRRNFDLETISIIYIYWTQSVDQCLIFTA